MTVKSIPIINLTKRSRRFCLHQRRGFNYEFSDD